ncbi:MHYT domain-containing protein [Paenibacillus alba]|uniref:MHYT domain-containing protein n=1 Tax=Paenibacillus alba TaxID=1197127 RepID=UPI001FE3DB4B|nr:MHYT domain-containing protein [Paenibacillus alba]
MEHIHGSYDVALVIFSYIVAVVASYTVLDLVGKISSSKGGYRWLWQLFGAIAMGMGIWSMHFVGMLAFSLSVPVAYNLLRSSSLSLWLLLLRSLPYLWWVEAS